MIEKGENVFLSGPGGTGKSLLLKYIIHEFDDKHTRVCAPTGLAAVNINGSTIHRLLNLNIKVDTLHEQPYKMPKALKGTYRVIVDEISMVRSDLFVWLTKCLRLAEKKNNHRIQLIVVGDFYQLAPIVARGYEKEYFKNGKQYAFPTSSWESWNFKPVLLHQVVRQNDPDFIENLNKIRVGDQLGIDYFNANFSKTELANAVTLTSRNITANKINNEHLAQIDARESTFIAEKKNKVSQSDEPVRRN